MRQFSVVVEWDSKDEIWATHVPALDYLSTYGDTREAALESTREAIVGYLEVAAKDPAASQRTRAKHRRA